MTCCCQKLSSIATRLKMKSQGLFGSHINGTVLPALASITILDLRRFECDDRANSSAE